MTDNSRVVKVLASLVASMTIGAGVLLVLGQRPLPAGAFSLASYSDLGPVELAVNDCRSSRPGRWQRLEVFYSRTAAGNVEQIAALRGLESSEDVNFHFLVCNGRGGEDGQIQTTARWSKQWSCVPGGSWYGSNETVRVCVIADDAAAGATDCQMKRTAELVEVLARKYAIGQHRISYPEGWQI